MHVATLRSADWVRIAIEGVRLNGIGRYLPRTQVTEEISDNALRGRLNLGAGGDHQPWIAIAWFVDSRCGSLQKFIV